jgi:lysophospholipase
MLQGLNVSSGKVDFLDLVDGGLSNLNIPLQPLLVPARNVDVILAVDSSYDYTSEYAGETTYLPNGAALIAQAEYNEENGLWFPDIPTREQFDYCNHTFMEKPHFFGCNQTDHPSMICSPHTQSGTSACMSRRTAGTRG